MPIREKTSISWYGTHPNEYRLTGICLLEQKGFRIVE